MKRSFKLVSALFNILILLSFSTLAQAAKPALPRYDVSFPDVPGCKTLVCDLHMHTVFSDGRVWPTIRLEEAWRTGLDMIAITDHIEVQPHKEDVSTDHNRSADMVAGSAANYDLLFTKGTEITRSTPPGHYNAIFLNDVQPLDTPDFLDSIKAANEQGAFVFWNHHDWKGKERGNWSEVQDTMLKNKWLHGMEVANHNSYYPRAHKWCLEKGLTMLGNSDIHYPDLRLKSTAENHRSLTLVFAKERTVPSVKEALQEGHTAVWHKEMLIGREAQLSPLFAECVKFEPIHHRVDKTVYLKVRNLSPMDLKLTRTGSIGPKKLALPAGSIKLLKLVVPTSMEEIQLDYTVENFLIAPENGLPVSVKIDNSH